MEISPSKCVYANYYCLGRKWQINVFQLAEQLTIGLWSGPMKLEPKMLQLHFPLRRHPRAAQLANLVRVLLQNERNRIRNAITFDENYQNEFNIESKIKPNQKEKRINASEKKPHKKHARKKEKKTKTTIIRSFR